MLAPALHLSIVSGGDMKKLNYTPEQLERAIKEIEHDIEVLHIMSLKNIDNNKWELSKIETYKANLQKLCQLKEEVSK